MKRIIILSAFIYLMLISLAYAQKLENKFFSPNPNLTKEEREIIQKAMKYEKSEGNVAPVVGPDGSVQYLFGAQRPIVVCSPLHSTVIELQPGETFRSLHIGDRVRWRIDPAVSGSGDQEVLHMVVKPTDVGLETNLVFFSDRRVYHFVLKSHRTEYMPRVSFVYPDDVLTKWQSIRTKEQTLRQARTTQSGEYLGDLDFEYDVSGNAPWKPVRVYNDGVKTVIQMPAEMKQTEAPALLVLKRPGGIIKDEELAVVNYRLHGNRYVVDNLFETAILVAGVGRSQERITITRRER